MDSASDRAVHPSDATRLNREHFALASPFATPASETERRLLGIWENVLDIGGLGVNDDFFELGGESLAAVTLFTEMERALGKMPPLSSLLEYPTVRRLAGRLDQLRGNAAERPLVPVRTGKQRPPLFCCHAGTGNVVFVRNLLPFLNPEQPLYGIQARGLEEGETPHRRFETMAADYVAQIRRVQPEGPYFLAGTCVGAYTAYEMARHLRATGQEVGALIMIDPDYNPNAAPWLYWSNPDAFPVRVWRVFVRLFWIVRKELRRERQKVKRLRARSQPFETGRNIQRQSAVRAGLRDALRAYRPQPYDGRLTIICSVERIATLSNAERGWPKFAPQAEFIDIGAEHHDAFYDALSRLGTAVSEILDRAQAVAAPGIKSAAE